VKKSLIRLFFLLRVFRWHSTSHNRTNPVKAPYAFRPPQLCGFILCLVLGLGSFTPSARAATLYWSATTGNWNIASNWSTDLAGTTPATAFPGISDDLIFSSTPFDSTIGAINPSGNQSANSLTFNSTGANSFNGASSTSYMLSIGSGGITVNSGAGAVSIGGSSNATTQLNVMSSQTWTNNSANSLSFGRGITVSAGVSTATFVTLSGTGNFAATTRNIITDGSTAGGTLGFIMNGLGTLTLQSVSANIPNTFSGGVQINSGTVSIGASANGGTGAVTLGNTVGSENATFNSNSGVSNNFTVQAGTSGNVLGINAAASSTALYTGAFTLNNNLALGSTATSTAGASYTLTGVVSGSGNLKLTRLGAGTQNSNLFLTGSNTYTGKTILDTGITTITSLNSVSGGTASSSLGAPTTLANGTIDIGGLSASTLKYLGAGETTDRVINMAGTTTGVTIDSSGTGALIFSSNLTATGVGAKTLTLQGNNTGNNAINGAIVNSGSGATALTKTGPGTWVLGGANTYTGATILTGGTVTLNYATNNNSKVAGVLTLSGVNLNLSGGSTAQAVTSTTLTAGASSINRPSGSSTMALGALTATAAGSTLNLGAGSIASTTTAVTAGILTPRITVAGADWGVSGASGTNAITALASGSYSSLATVTGTDTLNSLQTDNASLSGSRTTNTLKIKTTTTGQSLALGANNLKVTAGGLLFVGADDYAISGSTGVLSSGIATNSDLIVQQFGAGNLTISAIIGNGNGTSTLTKAGTGTLTLTGSNTYTGQTYINQGIVSINSNAALGAIATGATINLNGGTLQQAVGTGDLALDNAGSNKRLVALGANGGTISVLGTDNLTISGVISGAASTTGALTKSGVGKLTLTGANSYAGGTTIAGGVVVAGNASALGNAAGILGFGVSSSGTFQLNNFSVTVGGLTGDSTAAVSNSGTTTASVLTINNLTAFDYAGVLADGGSATLSLTKLGNGTQILSGLNTYTGTTTVSNGFLQIGNGSTTGTLGTGGVANNASLIFNRSDAITVSNLIAGTGSVTQAGASTLTLSGSNTFSGGLTINSGTVRANNASASNLGTGIVTMANNTTLDLNGNSSTISGLATSGNGSGALITSSAAGTLLLTFSAVSGTRDFAGVIENGSATSLGLIVALGAGSNNGPGGAGMQYLTGANTYTGSTSILAGSVVVKSLNSVVGGTASSSLGAPITIANGTISFGSSGTSAALSYIGTGETTDRVINLAGTTGGVTLDQAGTGLLKFTSTLTATVNGAKTLTLQGSTAGTGEIAGAIVNSANATSVTKAGTGKWTLSGSSTYTGATTVNAGTLLINGSIASAVTVSGGVFGGTGRITNSVSVGNAGTIAAGNSPGILNTGTFSLTGTGSTIAMEISGTGAGQYDQINVTGAVNLNGNGRIEMTMLSGFTPGSTDIFFLVLNDSSDAISGTLFGLAQAGQFTSGGYTWQVSYTGDSTGSTFTGGNDLALMVVPEPQTWILLAGGLTVMTVFRRRRMA